MSGATTAGAPAAPSRMQWSGEFTAALLLTLSSAAEYISMGVQAVGNQGPQSHAVGALMGLATAIVGLLITGAFGKLTPLISGPRAATIVLMGQAISALGSSPDIGPLGLYAVLACASLSVMIAGLTQLLLALFKGGTLTRMLPASVMSGLLFSSAVFVMADQAQHVAVCTAGWWPASVVVFSGVLAYWIWHQYTKDRYPQYKGLALFWALIVACASYYAINRFSPAIAECRTLGVSGLDPSVALQLGRPQWPKIFRDMSGKTMLFVVGYGLLIGLIATLDSLVAVGALEEASDKRARPNWELGVQGVTNLLAGFLGGLAVEASVTRSKLAWTTDGRTRLTAFLHAAMLIALLALGTSLLGKLPVLAASAVMIAMAIDMVDVWSKTITKLGFSAAKPRDIIAPAMWLFLIVAVVTIVSNELWAGFLTGVTLTGLAGVFMRPAKPKTSTSRDADRCTISVEGDLTNFGVESGLIDVVDALMTSANRPAEVDINLIGIGRIDASACRALQQMSSRVSLLGVSVAFFLRPDQSKALEALQAFEVRPLACAIK